MKENKFEKFYDETGELEEEDSLRKELITPTPSSFPTVERLVSFIPTQKTPLGEINPPPEFIVVLRDLHLAIKACNKASEVLKVVNDNLIKIDSEKTKENARFIAGKKRLLIRAGQDEITKILKLESVE